MIASSHIRLGSRLGLVGSVGRNVLSLIFIAQLFAELREHTLKSAYELRQACGCEDKDGNEDNN